VDIVANYDEMLAVLRVIHAHASITDKDKACNPCDTTGLAQATGLEPQEVADRLGDALRRGRMIEARETPGGTKPYYVDIRLTRNGEAAVEAAMRAEPKDQGD
jgi:hypothetical protein